MAKVMGVNITSSHAFFAVADDGVIVDGHVERSDVPQAQSGGVQLVEALADLNRRLAASDPALIAILQAETNYTDTDVGWRPRMTYEALIRVAAGERQIPTEFLGRAAVRSRLSLGRKGKLADHLGAAGDAVGRYWTAGRGLAALTALAAHEENG